MAIKWELESNNLVVLHITGILGKDEHEEMLIEIESVIQKTGQISILALARDFEGWEKTEGWEDTSVSDRIDPLLSKLAIVGDEKWRDLATLFTLKGMRPVSIEYFSENQEDAARMWLDSDS